MIEPSAPPPRNTAPIKIILACCGCMTVAAVLAVIGIFMAFRSGSKAISDSREQAGRFLSAMERHEFDTALAMTSSATRRSLTVEKLADIMSMTEKRRGKPTGHSEQPSFFINNNNGVSTVRLGYTMQFEKGSTNVQLVMVRDANAWRVQSFNFQL